MVDDWLNKSIPHSGMLCSCKKWWEVFLCNILKQYPGANKKCGILCRTYNSVDSEQARLGVPGTEVTTLAWTENDGKFNQK